MKMIGSAIQAFTACAMAVTMIDLLSASGIASLAHFHSPCIVKLDDFIDLQELVSSAAQPEQPAAGLVLLELQLMFVGSVDIRLQHFC